MNEPKPMNFQLPVARYRCVFRAETPIRFPAYAGSTWRGAFGHALRRTVCMTREPECGQCLLWRSCVYSQVFETPAGRGPMLEKVNTAPHPYIMHPLETSGRQYAPGDEFALYLTLLGKAVEHLPYLIHSLQQVGERGLGKQGGQCSLQQVEQENEVGSGVWVSIHTSGGSLQALPGNVPLVPPVPDGEVRVHLHTPFRLLQEGTPVHSERFSFQLFFNTLMRRLSLLHAFHAGVELEADFKALSQQAAAVPLLQAQLHWHEWSRYSNRQQSKVQMGGLLGSFGLPAGQLAEFWPWLWQGQWVHAGKGAVMGMGGYSLDC
ncbi:MULTISPECIES: CRISPR system precrRNA processing endoribonuclease RAMP protein Cas6 [unclassified Thiothrix]|uniref:CRISPR system precrRNA processing endoribonuclease RAMP protein Cas6 n=1 Tax=unclassified Thiothrix TaxID=2636184 RepID=UPI0025E4CB6C|nr:MULTISPECIES: CRISPR system precrRNA processing endoribonuclease RAMP protein Cas6 [unclassified Thiothrix]HRJ93686.1 CRISPR system precrRNA processing endoribonuclease RAMP protein Cas6 [Candidatus Thiothrix moscowensis]